MTVKGSSPASCALRGQRVSELLVAQLPKTIQKCSVHEGSGPCASPCFHILDVCIDFVVLCSLIADWDGSLENDSQDPRVSRRP